MGIDFEKVLLHANAKLDVSSPGDGRQECLEALKRFLKIETERLRIRHRFGLGGSEIATGRSYLVDLVVSRACQFVASEFGPTLSHDLEQVAVVALGGYGRRELAPFSDVDLLFLHGRTSEGIQALVERVLALLWDAGLTVGHSFRTLADCIAMAREDLHSRTALSEARLVTGSQTLFQELVGQMDGLVFGNVRTTEAFLDALRFELAERYARFGQAVCLQEPQVKESAGGLRDLHFVQWVGHARFGCRGLAALHERGWLGEPEYLVARRAYEYLSRVRNEAHFTTGRKSDLLTLDLQPALAENMGYRPKRGRLASEIFMRDYYQRASELHRFSRDFLLRHAAPPKRKRRFALSLLRRRARGTFEVKDGQLHTRLRSDSLGSGARLLEAFALAQNEGLELSEELKLDIRSSLHLVDRGFRASREAGRAFLRVLAHKGRVASTLRAMHETGFLGRYLPEFARVTFLVQHDFFHRYTVDEHTLRAIEALDQLVGSKEQGLARLRNVLDGIEDPAPLYLGMLLHDIGKGHGGGHVPRGVRSGERLCARLGLDSRTTADALFLVGAHLEMSQVSQRRDLSEPGLIDAFAGRVGSPERLDKLLLLTYADHCGVGPGIWNEWKASLLWDLYLRTRSYLVASRPGSQERGLRPPGWRRASVQLRAEFPASEVERHFALMPERYLRGAEPEDMVGHFRLLRQLTSRILAAEWRTPSEEHCTELTIATRDCSGLFARLAGTLTAHSIDILSVDLYTREDGVVLDVFKVQEVGSHGPVRAQRRTKVEDDLRAAVEGRYDVAQSVEKWRTQARGRAKRRPAAVPVVRFDSDASASHTVIEVRAEDAPGLAFSIANTLSSCGLNIGLAKIATEKRYALDVFYVTDAQGGKLDPEERSRVEGALLVALGPRQARHSP